MNLRTGARLFLARNTGRSLDFQTFLEGVRSHYRGWHVALLLDEDSCHTAKASVEKATGMTLLWLPNRSPKLNPIENLWGEGKEVISANKQYSPIEEQAHRLLDYLSGLSNSQTLKVSGALSPKFWLKAALSK